MQKITCRKCGAEPQARLAPEIVDQITRGKMSFSCARCSAQRRTQYAATCSRCGAGSTQNRLASDLAVSCLITHPERVALCTVCAPPEQGFHDHVTGLIHRASARTAPVAAKVSAPARAEIDSIARDSGGRMTRSTAVATAIDDALIVGADGLNGIERTTAAGMKDPAARARFVARRTQRRADALKIKAGAASLKVQAAERDTRRAGKI